jgi:hypothetical protein
MGKLLPNSSMSYYEGEAMVGAVYGSADYLKVMAASLWQ